MGHIDPTKEVFAQFKANDRPGPIHMLNLVRLRKQARLYRYEEVLLPQGFLCSYDVSEIDQCP